jgi:hypothetical protein
MYDVFIASLRCPSCSHVSDISENTNMQTHLRDDANGSGLPIGFVFDEADLEARNIAESGYLLVKDPGTGSNIYILNTWHCPSCGTEQWALVKIADGVLDDISGLLMNREALDRSNFIGEGAAALLAAALLDIAPWELTERKLDPIEVLRQRLT